MNQSPSRNNGHLLVWHAIVRSLFQRLAHDPVLYVEEEEGECGDELALGLTFDERDLVLHMLSFGRRRTVPGSAFSSIVPSRDTLPLSGSFDADLDYTFQHFPK